MKKLLELEAKLIKAKEDLEKSLLGDMNPVQKMEDQTGMPPGTVNNASTGVFKEEEIKGCDDKDKAKKIMEEEMDEHNEKKHGEAKDTDSAKKTEMVKFQKNGQWSLSKASQIDAKPNGEFDVPVKEVYDGDDEFVHVGNRSVDGDDKGKTQKLSDKEKQMSRDKNV